MNPSVTLALALRSDPAGQHDCERNYFVAKSGGKNKKCGSKACQSLKSNYVVGPPVLPIAPAYSVSPSRPTHTHTYILPTHTHRHTVHRLNVSYKKKQKKKEENNNWKKTASLLQLLMRGWITGVLDILLDLCKLSFEPQLKWKATLCDPAELG